MRARAIATGVRGRGWRDSRCDAALVTQHVDLHVIKAGSLQRLVPPGRAGRILPASADEPGGVLDQPPHARESSRSKLQQLPGYDAAVASLQRVQREHHVAYHEPPARLQDAPGLGKRAMLVGAAELVQAVVRN